MAQEKNEGLRVRLIKGGAKALASLAEEPEDKFFQGTGAIKPPYDPELLAEIFEESNILRQNVEAYATNIDGFGYTLEPIVDFKTDEGRKIVAAELLREGKKASSSEVDTRIAEHLEAAERERIDLRGFLDYVGIGISFTTLRKQKRLDEEVTGNAYWEVVRNGEGEIAKLVNVPAPTMRLMPLQGDPVVVEEKQRVGPMQWENVEVARRFRTYVQRLYASYVPSTDDATVYFKEYGDPRAVSAKSGKIYKDEDLLKSAEGPDAIPANEIIHFTIHSPTSPYGVPRWIGNLASVMGSAEMERVNYNYFKHKGVPPLAILVSGGVLTDPAVEKIEQVIEEEIKGTDNWHKVLVIEATTQEGSNVAPKVEMKPLMESVLKDQVFGKYDERNIDKVSSAFRVPRLLRGDVRDFNRATAYASIRFAEEQVFSGEREEFDFIFNRTVLVDRGVKYWRFVSQGPRIRDPETIMNLAVDAAKASAISPNEVRSIMSRALGIELARIEEDWATRPPSFTLAGRGYLPGEEGAPVTQGQATGLMNDMDRLQKKVATLVMKVEQGIEDEEVRAFAQEVARMSALDQETLDVHDSDQGSRVAEGERGDAAGGDPQDQ